MSALLIAAPSPANSAAEPSNLPRLNAKTSDGGYRIAPQDELTITVWANKDIWSRISAQGQQAPQNSVVQNDGTIVLPLLRNITVAGLTIAEAITKISDAYARVLGSGFQVDGQISKFRSQTVFLDGTFNRPGIVHLSTELRTLGDAISAGGGFQEGADASNGVLVRGDKRYAIDYQTAREGTSSLQDITLRHGDRIFFPSRNAQVYYVFGEVGIQGAFSIPQHGITLLQSLASAKGPNMLSADMESIVLIRNIDKEVKIYQLTLAEIMANRDLPIMSGDRIFLPPTTLTDWDRTMRQLIPLVVPIASVVNSN